MARRMVVAAGVVLFAACAAQPPPQEAPQMADRAAGTELIGSAFGAPLPGLGAEELALFEEGRTAFMQEEDVADGLGPVFNEASCVACHLGPGSAVGGSNGRLETRFGKANADGTFDSLAAKGGSLLQDHAIGMQIGHTPPDPNSSFDFLAEARAYFSAEPDFDVRVLACELLIGLGEQVYSAWKGPPRYSQLEAVARRTLALL